MTKTRIQDDLVRQRLFLIRRSKKVGVTQACSEIGKHRDYFYYWYRRYKQAGIPGLKDKSRRPHNSPRRTAAEKEELIRKFRIKTSYGKERLQDEIFDKTGILISKNTIGKVLSRLKLTVEKRRFATQKKHTRCYNVLYPGQRVQMDIKYVPSELCPFGKRFYQYTVIDECTRLRHLEWHDSIWNKNVVETLANAQRYFGFPIETVQTDNGIEFTYRYTAELTAIHKEPKEHPLDRYCRLNDIRHKLIPPGEKELNGKVERSHRTDDEEFYRRQKKRFKDLKELRRKGERWQHFYNKLRRHSGIGRKTPLEFYRSRLDWIDRLTPV